MSSTSEIGEHVGEKANTMSRKDKAKIYAGTAVITFFACVFMINLIASIFEEENKGKPEFGGDTAAYADIREMGSDMDGRTSGKVVAVEQDTGELHPLHAMLPVNLKARTPGDVGTVALIHTEYIYLFDVVSLTYDAETKSEIPDPYSPSIPAYKSIWDVTVIDYKNKEVIAEKTYVGGIPPEHISFSKKEGAPGIGVSQWYKDIGGGYQYIPNDSSVMLGTVGGLELSDGRRIVGVVGPVDTDNIITMLYSLNEIKPSGPDMGPFLIRMIVFALVLPVVIKIVNKKLISDSTSQNKNSREQN